MDEINKQAKLNKFWGIWNFVEAIILLGAGILSIVVASTSNVSSMNIESIIAYVVGAFIFLDGILRVVMSLSHYKGINNTDESGMLVGGFEIAVAVTMILLEVHFYNATKQHVFTYLIANFIAVSLIVIGLLIIIFSIVTIVRKYAKLFMPILEILFSAILIGVGITILVLYYREDNSSIVLVLTGSVLIVASLAQGIITLVTLKKAKKQIKNIGKVDVLNDYASSSVAPTNAKTVKAKDAKEVYGEEKPIQAEPIQIKGLEVNKIEGPKN